MLTVVALLCAAAMAAVALLVARPALEPPSWRHVLGFAAVGVGVTAALGALAGYQDLSFLVGASSASAAVLVPLLGIARAAGMHGRDYVAVGALWSAVVLPPSLVAPLVVVDAVGDGGGLQDFGGALGLVVSAAAYVLALSAPAVAADPVGPARASTPLRVLSVAVFWVVFAVWLTSLEGAVDTFTPRIALAAVLAPLGGGIGWLLVDRLKAVDEPTRRSVRYGVLAGAAAILSCVVAVPLVAAPFVGVVAGCVGAMVHAMPRVRAARVAIRSGVTALAAGGTGLLASAVIGEDAGFVADANVQTFTAHLLAFAAVCAWALGVALLARRVTHLRHRIAGARRR